MCLVNDYFLQLIEDCRVSRTRALLIPYQSTPGHKPDLDILDYSKIDFDLTFVFPKGS